MLPVKVSKSGWFSNVRVSQSDWVFFVERTSVKCWLAFGLTSVKTWLDSGCTCVGLWAVFRSTSDDFWLACADWRPSWQYPRWWFSRCYVESPGDGSQNMFARVSRFQWLALSLGDHVLPQRDQCRAALMRPYLARWSSNGMWSALTFNFVITVCQDLISE